MAFLVYLLLLRLLETQTVDLMRAEEDLLEEPVLEVGGACGAIEDEATTTVGMVAGRPEDCCRGTWGGAATTSTSSSPGLVGALPDPAAPCAVSLG